MLITLTSASDPQIAASLKRFEDVDVAVDAPQSVVITDTKAVPVQIALASGDDVAGFLSRGRPGRPLFLLVNAVLDDEMAARLEDAGVGYLDGSGRRWLWGGERTQRARTGATGGRRTLYPASIRLVQLLADHPDEPWTQRGLAQRGRASQPTAQRLLSRLEALGLVERKGQGPASARWVRDPIEMRSWLAQEGRPRRVARLDCFVRDPTRLPQLPGRSFALTGSAAAREIGFTVHTAEVDPTVRVNVAEDELEAIPEAFGGFRTESGANLTLIADPERLAFIDPIQDPGGRLIAPPSRIMLDLFLEPRGDAAAAVFLDLWGRREFSQ